MNVTDIATPAVIADLDRVDRVERNVAKLQAGTYVYHDRKTVH